MFMHVDREDHVHTSFQCRLLDKVGYRVREAAESVAATKKSATYEQQQQQPQHQHHRVCTSDPTRKTTCFSLILSPRILTTTTTRTTIYRSGFSSHFISLLFGARAYACVDCCTQERALLLPCRPPPIEIVALCAAKDDLYGTTAAAAREFSRAQIEERVHAFSVEAKEGFS